MIISKEQYLKAMRETTKAGMERSTKPDDTLLGLILSTMNEALAKKTAHIMYDEGLMGSLDVDAITYAKAYLAAVEKVIKEDLFARINQDGTYALLCVGNISNLIGILFVDPIVERKGLSHD